MNIEKKIKKVLNNNGVTTKATDENMWVIRVNKKLIKELSQLLQESKYKESDGYFYMVNNGAYEGWSISEPIKTLDEAVKFGIQNSYGSEFKVIKEIEWTAKPTNKESKE